MKSTKIYIVRHGQSVYNRDDIIGGHANPPLTDLGKQQALAAKKRLSNIHFHTAYSSDLDRAIQTAAIIYGKPIAPSNQIPDLRERDFGQFDGKPGEHFRSVRTVNQKIFDSLSHDQRWQFKHAPDVESDHELSLRFVSALEEIALNNIGKTVLVAAHGGSLRIMLIKLGHGTYDDFPPESIKNAAVIELGYDGQEFMVKSVINLDT